MTQPLWSPSAARVAKARLTGFIAGLGEPGVSDYPSLYAWSIQNPELFWAAVWRFCGVVSGRTWDRVLEGGDRMSGARWFPGATLNFAENLMGAAGERPALVFRAESGERRELSRAELHREVARLAAGLRATGVGVGDRVAVYLPNVPETATPSARLSSRRIKNAASLFATQGAQRVFPRTPIASVPRALGCPGSIRKALVLSRSPSLAKLCARHLLPAAQLAVSCTPRSFPSRMPQLDQGQRDRQLAWGGSASPPNQRSPGCIHAVLSGCSPGSKSYSCPSSPKSHRVRRQSNSGAGRGPKVDQSRHQFRRTVYRGTR